MAAWRDELDDRWSGRDREKPDAREGHQRFYAGLRKPRELTHDSQVHRAYLETAERLRGEGASIRRVGARQVGKTPELSSGRAAELLGQQRGDFIRYAGAKGIP